MNLINNSLRLPLILAIGLGAAPVLPTIAHAAGQTFERCESVAFQGNELAPGKDTFYDGYVQVEQGGRFTFTCTKADGSVTVETGRCGTGGHSDRRARGEIRGGVFYFGCA